MTVLAPLGLAALVGIPLIILFHMRHFTPVERHVPTIRFWKASNPTRTDDARFRVPPLTLLLLLQLLAAGLLGAALARPAVSEAWAGISQPAELRHLVVILDGSTSMSAADAEDGQSRYEAARSSAVAHLDGLREGDMATLMVLGTQVTTMQAEGGTEIDQLADRLGSLEAPGGIADLNAALNLVADLDLPGVREEILVLSDGAITADPAVVEKLHARIEFERFGEQRPGNLALTEIASRPAANHPERIDLLVQVTNFSDERATTTLLAAADGFEIYREELALDANGSTNVVIATTPPDAREVVIEVQSTDPFFADNQARVLMHQDSAFALRILLVSDAADHLQRALRSLPGATVDTVTSVENLRGEVPPGPYDLVVYEGTSPPEKAVPDVPLVLVNPPRDGLIPMSGMMTQPSVERIRANDPVLRGGVDLTGLTFFETPVHELDASAVEIVGAQGGPLIYRATVPGRDQTMIVLAFDLQQSNLPQRIAFPILVANIVGELSPSPLPSTIWLGDPVTYTPHANAAAVVVTDPRGQVFELPVAQADEGDGSQEFSREVTFTATGFPGVYQLSELNSADQMVAATSFSVNAGHPRESDLRADAELEEILATASAGEEGGVDRVMNDLWPALAAVALLVLLIEWFLSGLQERRSRRATPSVVRS